MQTKLICPDKLDLSSRAFLWGFGNWTSMMLAEVLPNFFLVKYAQKSLDLILRPLLFFWSIFQMKEIKPATVFHNQCSLIQSPAPCWRKPVLPLNSNKLFFRAKFGFKGKFYCLILWKRASVGICDRNAHLGVGGKMVACWNGLERGQWDLPEGIWDVPSIIHNSANPLDVAFIGLSYLLWFLWDPLPFPHSPHVCDRLSN